jgi:hypothetical protein
MFQHKSNDTNVTQYNQVLVALFIRFILASNPSSVATGTLAPRVCCGKVLQEKVLQFLFGRL